MRFSAGIEQSSPCCVEDLREEEVLFDTDELMNGYLWGLLGI